MIFIVIIIKSQRDIQKIKVACKIVSEILEGLKTFIKPDITTFLIEKFVDIEVKKRKVVAAFKEYRGYPSSVCVSINSQVIHGIPSKLVRIKERDIVSIDLGILCDGFYGDAAITIAVGNISKEALNLIRTTEKALYIGIEKAIVGNRVFDISSAIQKYIEANNFSVVRDFVGHGIGYMLHEDPQVPNFGTAGQGVRLREGMTLAIEPMVNIGRPGVKILSDGWTAVTADGSLSSHFEHTVAITKDGPKILTTID